MKKLLALVLAIVVVLSFASCAVGGNASQKTLLDVDVKAIMEGRIPDDIVYSELDPLSRQLLIEIGKQVGVDITITSDGTTSFKSGDKGEVYQKADGTWHAKTASGDEYEIITEWPDNEYTKHVPKPDFAMSAGTNEENNFAIGFMNVTLDQIKAYVQKIKDKVVENGFEAHPLESESDGSYSFTVIDADGYKILVYFTDGKCGLIIAKPTSADESTESEESTDLSESDDSIESNEAEE